MLSLVTPASEALVAAKARTPELHEFMYDDAKEFAEEASSLPEFRLDGRYESQMDALGTAILGFMHGEVAGIADRRDDGRLVALLPEEMIGCPAWNGAIRMMGDRLKSLTPMSVAMCYVYDLTDDEDGDAERILAAYGVAMGFQRGRQLVAGKALPLSQVEEGGLASTIGRLGRIASRAADETLRHIGEEIGLPFDANDDGTAELRRDIIRATEAYASNAVLSPVYADHLRCHQSVVVGRMRTFAYHFAKGMIDAATGDVRTEHLMEATFMEDMLAFSMLGDEPLPVAIRRVNEEACDTPLGEGMLPLATGYAYGLMGEYGNDGTGPIDFTLPDWEFVGDMPLYEPVDVTQRIALAAVAYACGLRQATLIGMSMEGTEDSVGPLPTTPRDWAESWDVTDDDGLPPWVSLRMTEGATATGVSHPIAEFPGDDVTPPLPEGPNPGSPLSGDGSRPRFRLV